MISREDLLKVERGIYRLIKLCCDARVNEMTDSKEYKLVVTLEHECHNMVKRITDLTEGKKKEA